VQLYASWNTGSGWVTETAILTQTFSAWNWYSSAATDGSYVYVAWHRDDAGNGRGRIYLARRLMQPSATWSYSQINPPHDDDWCYHRYPRLAVDSAGTLHAVWIGCARRNPSNSWPRDYYVFYATSSDQGATWSAPLRVHLISPDSYFDSRPALALAPSSRAMILYPVRLGTNREFAAALIQNGSVIFTRTLTTNAAWVPAGMYDGAWYGGDSAGDVVYDPSGDRFVFAVIDRSNGRAPRILTTEYFGPNFFPRSFVPMVRR
ncbi:MAG: glycoside hydrolase, partial [Thermoflexales bacterium]|nr:glycoside hydrolase [Thermoflexales bacterium]